MKTYDKIFYNGKWRTSTGNNYLDVIDSNTEKPIAKVINATHEDVDAAVDSARKSFPAWNETDPKERALFVQKILAGVIDRRSEIEETIIAELGSAKRFVQEGQVDMSINEIAATLEEFEHFSFAEPLDNTIIQKEGTGVVACITPWNYPLNQIQRKITPALLTGNTVVVNPASDTPLTAILYAEIIEDAGLPDGVFNLITGKGSDTGDYLSKHPDVDMISFTGSTAVGKGLYTNASTTVKKLVLELGGKSAMVYLKGGDLKFAVKSAADTVLDNQGQTCSALTRLFVPADELETTKQILKDYYADVVVGDPKNDHTKVGPMVSKTQMERVLSYIEKGKEEGAEVLLGGHRVDRPGYFIEPTVFVNVKNDMTIAQEEIFGPVLSVLTYDTPGEALRLANDSNYGLSGAVVGPPDQAYDFAKKMRTGNVSVNNSEDSSKAPFGGYKQSGLGRENGIYGLEDYLEIKTIFQ